jgi:hypothetical protein
LTTSPSHQGKGRTGEKEMAKWVNAKGDTITTNGTIYTITKNGHSSDCDVSRWAMTAEKWIRNDIASGYYSDFKEAQE